MVHTLFTINPVGGYIMSIVRLNPFNEMVGFQREMNRLFEDFFPARKGESSDSAVWRPTVDLHEDENAYIVDVELPGVNKEDVKINFQDGLLSISGERNYENESKEKDAHRLERFYGRFYRSFNFPNAVNGDDIVASYENGVLKVSVPKAEEVKPRQIEIK